MFLLHLQNKNYQTLDMLIYNFFYVYILIYFGSFVRSFNVEEDVERSIALNNFKRIITNDNIRLRYADYANIYQQNPKDDQETCGTAKIAVHWIQDTTYSFCQWLPQTIHDAIELQEQLTKTYGPAALAVSGFTDRIRHPHEGERSCYKTYSNLSTSLGNLRHNVEELSCSSGGGTREDSLSALYYGVDYLQRNSDVVNPRNGTAESSLHQFIVLLTDAEGKAYNAKGQLDENASVFLREDVNAMCHSDGYPSIDDLRKKLQEANVTPIFLVTEQVAHFYNNLLFELNVGGKVGVVSFDQSVAGNASRFIHDAVCAEKQILSGANVSGLTQYPEYSYKHKPNQSLELLPYLGYISSEDQNLCLGVGCSLNENSLNLAKEKGNTTKKQLALIAASAGGLGVAFLLFSVKPLEPKEEKNEPEIVLEREESLLSGDEREAMGNAELGREQTERMVDYSKWNHITCSSSDDDDDGHGRRTPHVTSFDKPQTVTFGGNQKRNGDSTYSVTPCVTENQNICLEDKKWKMSPEVNQVNELTEHVEKACRGEPTNVLSVKKSTKNGGFGPSYVWSQTKSEVMMIHWGLPEDIKGRDMSVTISELPDGHQRTTGKDVVDLGKASGRSLVVKYHGTCWLNKIFPYPVLLNDELIFWELRTIEYVDSPELLPQDLSSFPSLPFRALVIQVTKFNVISTAILWWNCLFVNDPVIDVTQLDDRLTEGATKRKSQFKKAWNEAHASFLESVKERKHTLLH